MVRVTGVFPPGHRRRRVMEDIHYQCDKADPLSDLTRVSSQGGSGRPSLLCNQWDEKQKQTFWHGCTRLQQARKADSMIHGCMYLVSIHVPCMSCTDNSHFHSRPCVEFILYCNYPRTKIAEFVSVVLLISHSCRVLHHHWLIDGSIAVRVHRVVKEMSPLSYVKN